MKRPCFCDRARIGEPYRDGDCRLCWLYHNDFRYRGLWQDEAEKKRASVQFSRYELRQCAELGSVLPGEQLRHCALRKRHCAIHGVCTTGVPISGIACCAHCSEHTERLHRIKEPEYIRFDETALPGPSGLRFNPSLAILREQERMVFVYRNGWRGSEIYLQELDWNWNPVGEAKHLCLFHPEANYGREDPRIFWHQGRLHVVYIGVVGGRRIRHTNVLYARLTEDLRVEQVFYPQVPGRNFWEKNHVYFSHGGEMYAIYTVCPHRIMRIRGEQAEFVYETNYKLPWSLDTELRGGACPVLHGEEYYHFFHSRYEVDGKRIYVTGVYTFEAEPPFRIRRFCPEPIDVADGKTNPGNYADVVFCGGAIFRDGHWYLACGIHDRWSEIRKFSHSAIEERLISIT